MQHFFSRIHQQQQEKSGERVTIFFRRVAQIAAHGVRHMFVVGIFFSPFVVFAQETSTARGRGLFWFGVGVVVLGGAFLGVAVWAILRYRNLSNDDPARTRARLMFLSTIIAGILFVILGLIFLFIGRARLQHGGAPLPSSVTPIQQGGLRTGILERHLPRRNETDVPRTTSIVLSFREAIHAPSVIDDRGTPHTTDDLVRQDAVQIRRADADSTQEPFLQNIRALMSNDGKTITLIPVDLLGTDTEAVTYTVRLTSVITSARGAAAIGNVTKYEWSFTTATTLDRTPPAIANIRPPLGATVAPNGLIQVTFTKPIDPTSIGLTPSGAQSIRVEQGQTRIAGAWSVGADGATIEFTPEASCGKNSCGNDVFCLPRRSTVTVTLVPARVGTDAPRALFPYEGIVDTQGNSFDGNGDGKSAGEPDDVYTWSFTVAADPDLTPPHILEVRPAPLSTFIDPHAPLEILFSKPIAQTSLDASTVFLEGSVVPLQFRFIEEEEKTRVIGAHDEPFPPDQLLTPHVLSGVRDIYQNCFQPCTGPGIPLGQCAIQPQS